MNKILIVVDIQPTYNPYFNFNLSEFIEYLNSDLYDIILYLYNGKEFGYEDNNEIFYWLIENGLNDELEYRITFFEKNYGFFRDFMDSGYQEDDIVNIGKYLIENNINDSRDIH
jgi:hypothetical protein